MKAKWTQTLLMAAAIALVTGAEARAEYPEKPVEMTVLFGGNAGSLLNQVFLPALSCD